MSQSDIAVSIRSLSKSYTIAHDQQKHVTLAERMLSRLKNPLRRPKTETFWALKDINFDVKRGDVVGIIGRNGAGKSTLLKILSRITEPTTGQIDLFGRVGSLLEVGTGFHPELTGRENIFLNGAILGMSKSEIRKQFDAIVSFAGVEQFLDTPVKRYSSGMYVRLAFAVAAHLNSEILIVDEVLAVGDAEFQSKCVGKMQELSRAEGRTVLFVSHNLESVLRLCTTACWIDKGSIHQCGDPIRIVKDYQVHRRSSNSTIDLKERSRSYSSLAQFSQISCLNDCVKSIPWSFEFGRHVRFACGVDTFAHLKDLSLAFAIFASSGFEVASARTKPCSSAPGRYDFNVMVRDLRLSPGSYRMNLGLSSASGEHDFVKDAASFDVVTNQSGSAKFADRIRAAVIPEIDVVMSGP
jgi:lipopolysaccharide transport system ATP-binding protein